MLKSSFFSMVLVFLIFVSPAMAQDRKTQGAIPVISAPVRLQDFSDALEALGTTKANETVLLTTDTTKKVTEIYFEDGQIVKKGALLLALDSSEEAAELNSAQAALAEAQASYDRAEGLQNNNALSKGTLQERLTTLKQNEAVIEEIKARLEKLSIVAPFDGVLGLREVSVGALIRPGDTITTIDDLEQVKVDFDVPSVFLSDLKPGMSVIGEVEAFGTRKFKGEVRTIRTQVDPVTRTVKVRAVFHNESFILKPGLLMTVTLLRNKREALLIPEESLIKRGEKNFVFLVVEKDGQKIAQQKEIEIGGRKPGLVEVLSGLLEGDQVVAHGTMKVGDGRPVTVRAVENENTPLSVLLEQKTVSEKQKD